MSTYLSGPVTVSVPATSANLGPGFDALGLALDLRDRVSVQVVTELPAGDVEISVTGAGKDSVPLDASHLVYRSMTEAFGQMGLPVPGLRLHCDNQIPHGRGMGSSSAAIVSGVCAARGLVAGGSMLMDDDAVFDLASRIEGHPDNVAPALWGGFTIAYAAAGRFHMTKSSVDPRVEVVVFVPPAPVETKYARGLLPATVPHSEAAANAARAALLVAALGQQPDLLLDATEDLLHQDYREPAMPDSLALVRALRADGVAAVISGAGPGVLVFTDPAGRESLARRVPDGWRARHLRIDQEGARVNLPE